MKIIIFILTNFFGNCDETCYSNDERIRALEIENRSLQQIIKSNQEMLAKMDDKVFQLASKCSGLSHNVVAPKSSGLSLHFLNHPFVQEYAITGNGIYNQVLPSNEIKEGVKAILADVFISFNKNDHFVLSFCSQPPCDQNKTGWSGNGGKFNNNFKENLHKAVLFHEGDGSGYFEVFGQWSSSVIIPVDGKSFSMSIFGSAGGSGNIQMIIRGMYE